MLIAPTARSHQGRYMTNAYEDEYLHRDESELVRSTTANCSMHDRAEDMSAAR